MKDLILDRYEFFTTVFGICPYCNEEVEADLEYGQLFNDFKCPYCNRQINVDLTFVYEQEG